MVSGRAKSYLRNGKRREFPADRTTHIWETDICIRKRERPFVRCLVTGNGFSTFLENDELKEVVMLRSGPSGAPRYRTIVGENDMRRYIREDSSKHRSNNQNGPV